MSDENQQQYDDPSEHKKLGVEVETTRVDEGTDEAKDDEATPDVNVEVAPADENTPNVDVNVSNPDNG